MTTLTDSFLSDLNELSYIHDDDVMDTETTNGENTMMKSFVVSQLIWNRYTVIINKLNEEEDLQLLLEDQDSCYRLVVEITELSMEIDNEIIVNHNIIRDRYREKFPELESIVLHPVDYATVVSRIGNEMDLTLVDLEGILPSSIIMVVTLAGSTTSGRVLLEDELNATVAACDRVIELATARKKIMEIVERTVVRLAPNVSAIVGTGVAAKLIVSAGGLEELQKKDGSSVRLLGAKKENLAGFSTQFRVGYIQQTEVYKSTPPGLRRRVCSLLGSKVVLAARIDFTRGDVSGKMGKTYLEEIRSKIEKLQELPAPRIEQAMPVPVLVSKRKRGGRRARKMKEKYAVTSHTERLRNRIRFGVPGNNSLDDGFEECTSD